VGAGVDRQILKYEKISPARSVIMQALGAAAIECWCDDVNAKITAEYGATKPRFSCGYGDLSIELQRDIFATLPLTKNLGITLSDRCFMTPTKSVTAIIGVKNDP
jgi:cobalamin-dependent methionine synthase I